MIKIEAKEFVQLNNKFKKKKHFNLKQIKLGINILKSNMLSI